jgi:hypothetical protein
MQPAEKGDSKAGDRALARWVDHEDLQALWRVREKVPVLVYLMPMSA